MSVTRIDRRTFLAGLGIAAGGLTLGVRVGRVFAADPDKPLSPNVFVTIAPDGAVTIVCHRSEMGQGVRTAMPMIVAEELDAEWSRVTVAQATGDKKFGGQNTDGSRSVRRFLEPLRQAGATARAMLIAAAAKRWRVPASRLATEAHAVVDRRRDRRLGYGELASLAATMPVPPASSIALKPRAEHRLIGRSQPIVDGADITTGKAIYGADVIRPGMLTAVIARPPAIGDEIESVDDKAALAIAGVRRVIRLPVADLPSQFAPLGGVAVVAEDTWTAIRGRRALSITWKPGRHRGYSSGPFRRQLEAAVSKPGEVARSQGDAAAVIDGARDVVSASYYVPHLAQAPMEPPAAVAEVSGGRCEIWTSVQTPQRARAEVASALGIDESAVTVNVTLLGGGFGRKSKPDFAVEAALLSREVKAPVRVQWTRTDDLGHGFFHTVSAQRLDAAIEGGAVKAWRHRTAFPSIGATFVAGLKHGSAGELSQGAVDMPFSIPNIAVENGEAEAHLRIGWMRSVANIYHGFAVGSFVDELAAHLGRDPKAMWLELLGPDRKLDPAKIGAKEAWNYGETDAAHFIDTGRYRRVIEAACARAGWGDRAAKKRALGLSAHRSFASYVATVIEVRRNREDFAGRGRASRPPAKSGNNGIEVVGAWTAIDCGLIVHRDRVRSQLEGAVIFGLSLALHGSITAKNGQVVERNFDDYQVLRMNQAPRSIDVQMLDSEHPPGGVGEPGVPPVSAALANAVYAATGQRLRDIPLRRRG